MKKLLRNVFSTFALLTLVACGGHIASDSSVDDSGSSAISDSGETSTTSGEVSSSSSDVSTSSNSSSSSASSASSSSSSSSASSSSQSSSTSSSSSSSSSSSIEVKFHVRFVNYDDTLLYETDVLAGNEAVYVGDEPTRPEDDEFTYTFKEWDHDLSSIASDLTTKAVYTAKGKEGWGPIIWF